MTSSVDSTNEKTRKAGLQEELVSVEFTTVKTSQRIPTVAGKHGFLTPLPDIQHSAMQTFSVGVFETFPKKNGKGVKKGAAKVRVQGPTALYDAVLSKASEVADQLDAGLYKGGKVVRVTKEA